MRLAITADWLPVYGGAEHVIAEMSRLWPEAPIFTTVAARTGLGPLQESDIRVTNLQTWFELLGNHRLLLPWMPRAMESIDLSDFDVIVSSSHAVGKGIIPPSQAAHICYCHTPMRYAWEMEDVYLQDFKVPLLFRRPIKKILSHLRRWDLTTAQRVDHFVANSTETKRRINEVYGRDSTVIHPPVSDRFFQDTQSPHLSKRSYLAFGRLVPYKRFDLLIEWANREKQLLTIAGTGPDEAKLRRLAGPTVTFTGFVPDGDVPELYKSAKAFLFPQFEDAGIVPLEAQACGTPVIAYGKGGALDTVKEGGTGLFFHEQTVDALTETIEQFENMRFDRCAIREHASKFKSEVFRRKMREEVAKACKS